MIDVARHTEAAFETVVEAHLLAHGYTSLSTGYDCARAIFPDVALRFIQATQPKEWAKLEALHGPNAPARVLDDLCKWMDTYGALHTLRHGFKCYGRTLRIAFFKAAHELNPDLEARYAANILGVTRQLRYNTPRDSQQKRGVLDLALSLNGIPIVTLELKNPLTGQNVEDAKRQYRADREVGTAIVRESEIALSELIDIINERFGTNFTPADQLFFDQIVETAAQSEELRQAAQVNSADKFALLFKRLLESLFVERMDQNEEIFGRYMNDRAFQKAVADLLASEVYERLTGGELSVLKYS